MVVAPAPGKTVMRFLIGADVPPDPDAGAAGTVVHIVAALRAAGYEVDALWSADLGRRIAHGNLHYLLELPWTYRNAVARRLAQRPYDMVLLSQPHAWRAARYVRRNTKKTIFLNLSHGWEGQAHEMMRRLPHCQSAPVRGYLQAAMRFLLARHEQKVVAYAHGIVVGASTVADYLTDKLSVPRSRILINPEGVPDDYLNQAAPANNAGRWKKLLYVGQFAPIKAPERVAEVINRVLHAVHAAQATWVCERSQHAVVRRMIDPMVQLRVTVRDWCPREELMTVFDQHGIFLFPSHYEGFGKAPLEAMSRGMAVVATAVGGPRDFIMHGQNGFLAVSGKVDELVAYVMHLIQNPATAARIGCAARETARVLTWSHYAGELVEFHVLLQQMIEKESR